MEGPLIMLMLDSDELGDEAIKEPYIHIFVKWAYESNVFMKHKDRIEDQEATKAHLSKRIAEMKRDSFDSLKERIETLPTEKANLMEIHTDLKKQAAKLSSDLAAMTKSVQMLNSGTSNLNEILRIGKPSSTLRGLGFH